MRQTVYYQQIAVRCPYCKTTKVNRLIRQYHEPEQVEDLFQCLECQGYFQQIVTRRYRQLSDRNIPPKIPEPIILYKNGSTGKIFLFFKSRDRRVMKTKEIADQFPGMKYAAVQATIDRLWRKKLIKKVGRGAWKYGPPKNLTIHIMEG